IITIILDSSSENISSDSDNNSSDSASTSKEIVYSSLECKSSKGPSKNISKAKACILAKAFESSSKVKVQASRSKAKVQASMAQASPKTLITFGVKIPPTITCAEEKKGKRKIEAVKTLCTCKTICLLLKCLDVRMLNSDNSDDNKGVPKEGPSITSVLEDGPSIQGLLDWYGYDTVEEYLEDTYFPSIDKDNTDEDTIHESYSLMFKGKYVPVSQKHNLKVKCPIPITGCVLGLANVTAWDDILKKIGVRKPGIYADKAKEKRKVSYGS
ncbi:hypothetical protein Tco_1039681, partial [Tanacetum coccineum]